MQTRRRVFEAMGPALPALAGGLALSWALAGAITGCAAGASGGGANAAQRAESGDLVCEAYCNPVTPGVSVVEVRFAVPGGPAPAAKLRAAAATQDIEASVYEDGFERGLFVRLPSVSPEAKFAAPPGVKPVQTIPGLDRLVVRAVATSEDPPGGLRLAQPGDAAPAGAAGVVLQVQGLQPGMNYYWRVRPQPQSEPQVVMCRAPICPADKRRPPAPPKPRPGP
jgi:hypothetical protein